jgi:hypothetical protein
LIRNKIEESSASIICFQETKRGVFDLAFIKNFAPRRFDRFAFIPSEDVSGGLLVLWASNLFEGQVLLEESFGLVMNFKSTVSGDCFKLVNMYGPCSGIKKGELCCLDVPPKYFR